MEAARSASLQDLPAIEAVAASVRADLDGGRGVELFFNREAQAWPLVARVMTLIADDEGIVVVGTYDNVVLGYAVAAIEPLLDGRLIGVVDDLAVDPEARKVGIGEAMMNEVIGQLCEVGCVGVDSRALPGDRNTKNFFESFGLKARLLTVHRSLLDDA